MNLIRERVERGAALLDERHPGWRDKVEPRHLEIACGRSCVLGQLYDEGSFAVHSGYVIGASALGIIDLMMVEHGQLVPAPEYYGFAYFGPATHDAWHTTYSEMQAAWLRQLP